MPLPEGALGVSLLLFHRVLLGALEDHFADRFLGDFLGEGLPALLHAVHIGDLVGDFLLPCLAGSLHFALIVVELVGVLVLGVVGEALRLGDLFLGHPLDDDLHALGELLPGLHVQPVVPLPG